MDSPTTHQDDAVLAEIAATSPAAFESIVRQHQHAVRIAVATLIPCPSTADDIAQEAFVAAYHGLAGFSGAGSLRSWLVGIARNKAKQFIRAETRRRERESAAYFVQLMQRLEPWEASTALASSELLQECLDQLGPESRQLIEAHYFEGQSLQAIAVSKARTSGSLRMMLLRIRKALATCIRSKGGA